MRGARPRRVVIAFHELAVAAYCPRQLYYARRTETWEPPTETTERRALAFRYRELGNDPAAVAAAPISIEPRRWLENLAAARRQRWWPAVCDPVGREVLVEGRRCRGVVHKLLEIDGPVPGIVSAGAPPDRGVWTTDSVRAVAAAKALASERGASIDRAIVEYPGYGIIRPITLTDRRRAAYRRALAAASTQSGRPPRVQNPNKCAACDFRRRCRPDAHPAPTGDRHSPSP